MSGKGAPAVRPVAGKGRLIAVVAATWHQEVMDGLVAGAVRELKASGAEWDVYRVPGSFELPVAVQRALAGAGPAHRNPGLAESGLTLPPSATRQYDAAVALGVVIRGGTPHFEYVCRAATDGLTRVALDTGKPVGFGVLTCENEEQALARAGLDGSIEDKGGEAAAAVLETLATLDQMTA
jgi:6,7-dimethyl-8-ribityllumazine synthase